MRFPILSSGTLAVRIGRDDQAKIVVHPGFAVLAIAATAPLWLGLTLASAGTVFAAFALLLVSLVTHELAHLGVARRNGVPLTRIDVGLFGSTSQFGSRPLRLSQDLALVFAGPAASLTAALVFCLALVPLLEPHYVKSGCETIEDGYEALSIPAKAFAFAMFANLAIGIVNLIPLRPFDAAGIAYSEIKRRGGALRADIVAGLHAAVLGTSSLLLLLALLIVGLQV